MRRWRTLTRWIYALAFGSVIISVLSALLVASFVTPGPHPRVIRAALWHLAQVADDGGLRDVEAARVASDVGIGLALYSEDGTRLFAATRRPPALPDEASRRGGVIDGRLDVAAASVPRGPREGEGPHVDRDDGAAPSREGRRPGEHGGPPHHAGDGHPRRMELFDLPPSVADLLITDELITPAGHHYFAVFSLPGPWRGLAAVTVGVIIVLASLALPFVRVFVRPLNQLAAATEAFGAGAASARVATGQGGAFAELGVAFNAMADRVTLSMRKEQELLRNVSHELRTPLARVRVALELAAEGDGAVARQALGEIEADVLELQQIIDDVLTHARLAGDDGPLGAPLRLVPTAVGSLVEQAAQRFTARFPGHTLRVTNSAPDAHILADGPLLRRALDNLLHNAGKYSEPSSQVELHVSMPHGEAAHRQPGCVSIAVVDHGVGIAAADQAHLFEPFFRAERSRDRASGGVGLGLVLARRIVEAHGGMLELVSAPGEGTTVRLRFTAHTTDGGRAA